MLEIEAMQKKLKRKLKPKGVPIFLNKKDYVPVVDIKKKTKKKKKKKKKEEEKKKKNKKVASKIKKSTKKSRRPKIRLGKAAPSWNLMAVIGEMQGLISLRFYGQRWLCLFSYPEDFDPLCQVHMLNVAALSSEFNALRADTVLYSMDSVNTHTMWLKYVGGEDFKLPMLSDPRGIVSKKYGCYNKKTARPVYAYYIIDPSGCLRHYAINDGNVCPNLNDVIATLQAVQAVHRPSYVVRAHEEEFLKPLKCINHKYYYNPQFKKVMTTSPVGFVKSKQKKKKKKQPSSQKAQVSQT